MANPKIIIDRQEILSYGYSDYTISGTQELIEIDPDDWPEGARKKDVYWDGSKVVIKTQDMVDQENQVEQNEKNKKDKDNKILEKLVMLLEQMIEELEPHDFNTLIENLKIKMSEIE